MLLNYAICISEEGAHSCVIQTQERKAELLGKPLTKLSAKGGFEQNICFRRTGIKSSHKAEKLYTLEMAVGQRTFWQAEVERKVILCRKSFMWGGNWSQCITAHRSQHFLIQSKSHEQDREQWPELPKRYWQKSEEVNRLMKTPPRIYDILHVLKSQIISNNEQTLGKLFVKHFKTRTPGW